MALEWVLGPIELCFVADIDEGVNRALQYRHPGVKNLGDITEVCYNEVELVDLLAAGFPCQDVSVAGRRAGLSKGTRTGLWSEVARAIEELEPPLVFLENVHGLLSGKADSYVEYCAGCMGDDPRKPLLRALGAVLGDLASLGYDAEWTSLRAADAGAPHKRERVFILARACRERLERPESLGIRIGQQSEPLDAGRSALGIAPVPQCEGSQGRQSPGNQARDDLAGYPRTAAYA